MKKVCYIVSKVNKSIAFEWIAQRLNFDKFEISFILLNEVPGEIYYELVKLDIPTHFIHLTNKRNYIHSGLKLNKTLLKIKPDIIHTHLRDADLLGLTVAKALGIKHRITTRHSSTFNHLWYPKAVKWDKYINRTATNIIAISKVVKDVLILRENVFESKIELIHHGFDLESFENVDALRFNIVKKKYQLPSDKIIIGVVARYIEWKGVQYIIEAFKNLCETRDDLFLILANANGPDSSHIKKMLTALPSRSYCEIEFEPDLFALFHSFHYYVHVPVDKNVEAFGQTYVEALAAGIPSVFTLSGVAHEFIKDHENALVVPYKNSRAIETALLELINNPKLCNYLVQNGKKDVARFQLNDFIDKLETFYTSL